MGLPFFCETQNESFSFRYNKSGCCFILPSSKWTKKFHKSIIKAFHTIETTAIKLPRPQLFKGGYSIYVLQKQAPNGINLSPKGTTMRTIMAQYWRVIPNQSAENWPLQRAVWNEGFRIGHRDGPFRMESRDNDIETQLVCWWYWN